jgi:hypothetical protein
MNRIDLNPVGDEAIEQMAFAYAHVLAHSIGGKCWNQSQWSFTHDDLVQSALMGYVEAKRRFTPPGDINKYIRAWMRGRIREILRQEAKSHGLVRPHTRRCKNSACNASLPHRDKHHGNKKYCLTCGDRKVRQRIYNQRYWRQHHETLSQKRKERRKKVT